MAGPFGVVAICAHEDTPHLRRMLADFRRSLGADRVYLLFDASKTAPPRDRHLLTFTNAECAARNPFHESNWHNMEYKIHLLKKALDETGEPFVWMIESDVGCDGDIATCLSRCRDSRADFMAFRTKAHADEPGWAWWESLRGEIADRVPVEDRVGCFFPVTRYSRAMIEAVERNMGKSSGHCEAYVPTLAIAEGLVVDEIPASVEGDVGFAIYATLPGRGDHRLYHKYVVPKEKGRISFVLYAVMLLLSLIVIFFVIRTPRRRIS